MYLDEELIDIDHLCCLAHARVKFKKALDQGCDKARYFLMKIGNFYSREKEYGRLVLSPDEILKRRSDTYTNGIVKDLWKAV